MARNKEQAGEEVSITLGALAAKAAIGANSAIVCTMPGWLNSMRLFMTWAGTSGDHHALAYGVASAHLSDAEIAAILNQTPDRMSDAETRLGYARLLDYITPAADQVASTFKINDSGWRKIVLEASDGDPLFRLFAYNTGTAAITTGGTYRAFVQSLTSYKRGS